LSGGRAQVETKWEDYCGIIDSQLRFKPAAPDGCILSGELASLVLVDCVPTCQHSIGQSKCGEWKIENEPRIRVAGIAPAIKYVERMREQSQDPLVRKNATNTIAALKRLSSGCGNASAC